VFRDGYARLLVFRVGVERFAVALASVMEVIDLPTLQPMPDAPPALLGVATIHDALVMVYDPRAMLNVGGGVAGAAGAALVFSHRGRCVALAIDDVFDAITVEENELRAVPGVGVDDGVLLGVIRRGADLMAVLDAPALLDAATMVSEGGRT
jgi:purine-binding chemotaxis protein CheW